MRWIPAMTRTPPRSRACQGDGHDLAGRREDDGGVQGHRGRGVGRARRGRTEVERQLSSLLGSGHHVDLGALVQRHLGGQVGGAAEPVDPEAAAGAKARPTQGAVPDDARAQQRCGLVVGKTVGDPVRVALVDDRGLGVPAVVVPSRERRLRAQVLVAASAELAPSARARQPGDADPVAQGETRGVGAERVDDADHLVAGDDVGAMDGQVSFGDVEIGPAHAARRHLHPDLTRARVGEGRARPCARGCRPRDRRDATSQARTTHGRASRGDRAQDGPCRTRTGARSART